MDYKPVPGSFVRRQIKSTNGKRKSYQEVGVVIDGPGSSKYVSCFFANAGQGQFPISSLDSVDTLREALDIYDLNSNDKLIPLDKKIFELLMQCLDLFAPNQTFDKITKALVNPQFNEFMYQRWGMEGLLYLADVHQRITRANTPEKPSFGVRRGLHLM